MKISKVKRSSLFADAYNDYYPLIFSVVNTKINNFEDAEDICQDVFYKFYEKIDEVKNYRKWLYGTLRIAVLEYFRKKNKNEHLNVDDVFNDMALTFANGFKDVRILITEAIEESENFKDDKEQILFELIAVHNYTYEKAGKQIGLTRRQVKYRYGLIVKRVLKFLEKKGISSLEELL